APTMDYGLRPEIVNAASSVVVNSPVIRNYTTAETIGTMAINRFDGRMLAFDAKAVTLANGVNNDVDVTGYSSIRITGPTGAFSITGFAGGIGGQMLLVNNAVAQDITFPNNNASSAVGNRIQTMTGGDLVGTGISTFIFRYSATTTTWLPFSTMA